MPVINPPPTRVPPELLAKPSTRAYFTELNNWALRVSKAIGSDGGIDFTEANITAFSTMQTSARVSALEERVSGINPIPATDRTPALLQEMETLKAQIATLGGIAAQVAALRQEIEYARTEIAALSSAPPQIQALSQRVDSVELLSLQG